MNKRDFAEALTRNRFATTDDPDQTLIVVWVSVIVGQFVGYKLFRKLGAPRWAAYAFSTLNATKAWADAKTEYKEVINDPHRS